MKKTFTLITLLIFLIGSIFTIATPLSKSLANSTARIEVTTTEEGGNTVQGSPSVTAIPADGKTVNQVTFYAKAINEPDSLYYPYAPDSSAPYTWTWPTGDPWVPDGKYMLKMVLEYSTGEVDTVTREIFVDNYSEPNAPASPNNLTVSSRSKSSVTLSWNPSVSDKLYNYVIYQNGTVIAETTSTSYTIDQLSVGSLYQFRVKAKDIYNNESVDDNTIGVLTAAKNGKVNSLPSISPIEAIGSSGATPGENGYSGTVQLSVTSADKESLNRVDFYVKTYESPESEYWKFPSTNQSGGTYSVNWDTTSAPEGKVIIKAVAYDSAGQSKTVTNVLLVDNVGDGQTSPGWEPADTPPANRIVGYLAGWATYGDYEIMRDLDASRLTHLNYAFAVIGDDLRIALSDPAKDLENFAELTQLKVHYPHLKTLIAVGGWGGSANFSEAAATHESREIFADSVVDFIVEHGFDGVDLDWEYPVTGGGPGTYPNPADRDNYPLLLETLRQKLDAQGQIDGKHYLLTIAGGATAGFAENTQLGYSQQYLDYVQIMTYDIHGTWETRADYNAPLFDDNGATYSVEIGVQAYLDAGVPADKLVMGVPFYGYRYNVTSTENNGLRQPFEGSGSITYKRIIQDGLLNNGYVRYWDEGTQVPYLFHAAESIFISYDDEESIARKAQFIRERQLGGAMIWEISQDYGNALLDSLYQVLKDPI
ncbi:glycosyl hydrolase family 18 protein [Bacillus litorisediminis]|uniref:glycosyl hydrolase family 18 protein n=1 Tax=Bacillus litorisediminis TaxID=2922713 RepID=UPI001FAFD6F5|nr:glycosyl hydrolase family 18 protein [Bacillus litorisediminis]